MTCGYNTMAVCRLPKPVTRVRFPLAALFLLILAGCATPSYHPKDLKASSAEGFYHEVHRGETLWGISRTYNVDLKKIINANRLPDASKIEVGQLIFIPDSKKALSKNTPYYAKKGESFVWPIKGRVISYFGSTKDLVKNKGIDIEAHEGANIIASRSGKITFASNHLKGYGKTVIIDHLDGFQTVYAHNSQNLAGEGSVVNQGDVIARAGKTGRAAKSSLHFEIRKNHEPENPFYYLP